MFKALIIDDDPKSRQDLKLLLATEYTIQVVGEGNNVEQGKALILNLKPDLVFLDIEMPDGTGFDLLESFSDVQFHVIFTSGHNEYAIKAFKHSAIDYLLKPIQSVELQNAIQRLEANDKRSKNQEKLKHLFDNLGQTEFYKIAIPSMESYEFINKKDILYCEADSNYALIHLVDGRKIISTHLLKKMEEILQESNFFRIHKSYIININFVSKVLKMNGGKVIMENKFEIPIARRRKEEFFDILNV